LLLIDEQIEKEVPSSVDNLSAISTVPISRPAHLAFNMKQRANRGVRLHVLVGLFHFTSQTILNHAHDESFAPRKRQELSSR
jgi:hypothetical protein